jgi:hypothetical protein
MQAASIRMLPVTAFGRPIEGCTVKSATVKEASDGQPKDFAARFRGLVASDIPAGKYEVLIGCPGSRLELYKRVTVDPIEGYEQMQIVARFERTMRSDPPPSLAIALKTPPRAGETWWIRMVGLYNGREYINWFQKDGTTGITDPDPGSYFVEIWSSGGYRCLRQIDFVEPTKRWTLDASTRTFELDRWAHLVGDADASGTGPWYDQMRQEQDELWRALEKAAEKQ